MKKLALIWLSICSSLAYAELPKSVEMELSKEIKAYEKLYQDKRGKKIYGYVNQKIIGNMAEKVGMPEVLKSMELLLVNLIKNRQVSLQMDLPDAQTGISPSGIAYAIIPYVMNIDGNPVKEKMLAIKDGKMWTFSRFNSDNPLMKKAIQDVYPDLELP
ncbi:hypothetical protein [Neisseria sp.]|uniref:hypothetical protein n=1 Tax=Neisseria sp. TaxID=192066 RepID=UPI00359F6B13